MDMNALLRAHQIAMFGEACAATSTHRAAYAGAIKALATRIRRARKAAGADVSGPRFLAGEPSPAYPDR